MTTTLWQSPPDRSSALKKCLSNASKTKKKNQHIHGGCHLHCSPLGFHNTYTRMKLVDFYSAFSTAYPMKLGSAPTNSGLLVTSGHISSTLLLHWSLGHSRAVCLVPSCSHWCSHAHDSRLTDRLWWSFQRNHRYEPDFHYEREEMSSLA